jgi:Flp pilus assembly pilin Flp
MELEGRRCKWVAQSLAHERLLASCSIGWDSLRKKMTPVEEMHMKAISKFVGKLVKDEQGGEVLEYALIAGLIVVAAIAVITAVGNKVVARWTSLNSSM